MSIESSKTKAANWRRWAKDNIDTNAAGVAANLASIGTNTSNISTNTTDIATNTAAIAAIPGFPTGGMVMWMTATAPTGYLECDGSAVSRTTYAALFAVLSDDYGNGDGSTTFNLPDLRGHFARGWDNGAGNDPDAASRTDRGDTTTGDNIGTLQADEFDSHTHVFRMRTNGTSAGSSASTMIHLDGTHATKVFNATFNESTGGNETRPLNINVMYIIKT